MNAKARVILLLGMLLSTVIGTSHVSTRIWGGKPEKIPGDIELVLSPEMSIKEFGNKNNIPGPVLKKSFSAQAKAGSAQKDFRDGDHGF